MRTKKIIYNGVAIACLAVTITACKSLRVATRTENKTVPASYNGSQDTVNTSQVHWKDLDK